MRKCVWLTGAVLAAAIVLPATADGTAAAGEPVHPPALTAITWLPRTTAGGQPVLHLRLALDAPAGLASGRVHLGSVWHEVRTAVDLGPLPPGAHSIPLSFVPPGDVARSWDVVGVTLRGSDGADTDLGYCDLANRMETREWPPSTPRVHTHCLDSPGWVVYTVRALDAGATGSLWARGVATRASTSVGTAFVLQDSAGAVVEWGTALGTAYPSKRDGTYVAVGGTTLVDDRKAHPSTQPWTNRVVLGFGGSSGTLTAGAVYRWGTYYAYRPGHSDLPLVSLEGSGLEVLDVEHGDEASIAWGEDFAPSVSVQRSDADASIIADGRLRRSFDRSATCMVAYVRSAQTSFGLVRTEGPDAPATGGVLVARQPGDYTFQALLGQGRSSEDFVGACADLPLVPQ